ncbi:MAG: sigma-70 family RNA polymerase sigma factor [Kiritimatiellia bacterium]
MAQIPPTSISLIQTLANDPSSKRWKDLYTNYEQPMREFLQANFPSVEAEDAIQETMLALMKALPNYCYTPDKKGHFHNYLMGILKHKAMNVLKRRARENRLRQRIPQPSASSASEDEEWRHAALEVAIAQLMADQTINPLHRTIFAHLVQLHEKPERIALQFGIGRSNVDVIKKRMIDRLSALMIRLIAS